MAPKPTDRALKPITKKSDAEAVKTVPRGDSEFRRHKELVENSKKPRDDPGPIVVHLPNGKNPNTFDNNGALWSDLMDARSYTNKNWEPSSKMSQAERLHKAVHHYTKFVNTFLEKAGASGLPESKIVEKVVNLYKNNDEAKKCLTTTLSGRDWMGCDWMPNFEFTLLERTETEPFVPVTKKPEDRDYLKDFLNYTPNVFIEAARVAEALLATDSLEPEEQGKVEKEEQDKVEKNKNLWWVLGIRCFETQVPKLMEYDIQNILPTYVKLAREVIYKMHGIALLDSTTELLDSTTELLDSTTELIFSQAVIEYEAYNPLAQFELYLDSAAFYSRAQRPKFASDLIEKAKDLMLKTVKARESEIELYLEGRINLGKDRFLLTLKRLMRWYWLADQLEVVLQHPSKPEDYFRNLYKPMEESKRSELESYKEAMQPLVDAAKDAANKDAADQE